jgi:hypothetical protein
MKNRWNSAGGDLDSLVANQAALLRQWFGAVDLG